MIRSFIFLIAAVFTFVGQAALAADSKPNFVIIFTDDQGVLFPASTKGLNAEEHTIADHTLVRKDTLRHALVSGIWDITLRRCLSSTDSIPTGEFHIVMI